MRKAFFGAKKSSKMAATIPAVEASRARCGTPLRLTLPIQSGPKPSRPNENSMRVERYKLVLTLESAAVSTTKFMIAAAKGTCAAEKAVTNGLPERPDELVLWSHGTMATIIATAST